MINKRGFEKAKSEAVVKWELIALSLRNAEQIVRQPCGFCKAMEENYNTVRCSDCPATNICGGEWFEDTKNDAIMASYSAEMVLDRLQNLEYTKYRKGEYVE